MRRLASLVARTHPFLQLELAAQVFLEQAERCKRRELNFDFRAPPLENDAPAHPPVSATLFLFTGSTRRYVACQNSDSRGKKMEPIRCITYGWPKVLAYGVAGCAWICSLFLLILVPEPLPICQLSLNVPDPLIQNMRRVKRGTLSSPQPERDSRFYCLFKLAGMCRGDVVVVFALSAIVDTFRGCSLKTPASFSTMEQPRQTRRTNL